MFLLIVNKKYIPPLKTVISNLGDTIFFCDEKDDIDVIEDIEEISLLAGKYLILDSSLNVDLEELLLALEQLRFKKDKLQYIILAPDKIKGDIVISRLVQFGIYNIISFSSTEEKDIYSTLWDKINSFLENPATYKDAIEWDNNKRDKIQVNNLSDEIQPKKDFIQIIEENKERFKLKTFESVKKEKVITVIKENLLGKITISVAGVIPHIGTTHFSIMVATFLKSLKFKVAILEFHESSDFESLYKNFSNTEIDNGFTIDNIDFYSYNSVEIMEIIQKKYDYIILDMGVFHKCNKSEFYRADEKFLISGSKVWEIPHLEIILKNEIKFLDGISFLFNFSSHKEFNFIKKNMKGLLVNQIPFNPDSFDITKENEFQLQKDILKKIIPNQKPKSNLSIKFPFLRRDD